MANTSGSRAATRRRLLTAANAMIVRLQRIGVVLGPMQVLTVTGRRTGRPRTVPVAVVTLSGSSYVFQAHPGAAWVANVRASGAGVLSRGRRSGQVRLVELPVAERRPVLRELADGAASVGKRFATNGLAASPATEDVVAAAERIAVFRVDPAAQERS